MKFGQLRDRGRGLVAISEQGIVRLGEELPGIDDLDDLIAAGPAALAKMHDRLSQSAPLPEADDSPVLGPPLRRPSKVIAVGLNFKDHARESGVELPTTPLLFAKFPSSIIGPGDEIEIPAITDEVDWEVELAVIIGRRARQVSPERALEYVFGYTIANDVSARDVQFSDGQWVRAKSFDSFCPLGPIVVTAGEFGDPQNRRLSARVNGETMQDSTTAEMVFTVAELISSISAWVTLEPGDVILTGTPWGVGAFRSPPVYLRPGDEVEVEVEGIGVLRNRVVHGTVKKGSAALEVST